MAALGFKSKAQKQRLAEIDEATRQTEAAKAHNERLRGQLEPLLPALAQRVERSLEIAIDAPPVVLGVVRNIGDPQALRLAIR